ncbi:MAG: hypothetical protein U0002_21360 [Thermoanaerobaculia bacterium]
MNDEQAQLLAIVERALKKDLALESFTGKAGQLLETKSCVFLMQPRLRFGGHFDPTLDFLIVDGRLGSLGLVSGFIEDGDCDSVCGTLRQRVEDAAYLRFLLLEAQRRAPSTQGWAVETVLVTRGSEVLERKVQQGLRDLARDTELLYATGLGWTHLLSTDVELKPEHLRRAFPWLLKACDGWLEANGRNGGGERVQKLVLENYRQRGTRTLEFAAGSPVHLIQGANSTGESHSGRGHRAGCDGQSREARGRGQLP